MQIFASELDLKDQITASVKASLVVPMSISDSKDTAFLASLSNKHDERLDKVIAKIVENPNASLMYASAILASTVMNRNDDVLLPEEMWKARFTPINTPVDEEHEFTDIIGHIFDARVLTKDGKVYSGETIPDYFDIGVDFVIYKELFPDIATDIMKKFSAGDAFVSMEAVLQNFDYALVSSTGSFKIIKRTDTTSFLTKYLRIYKGSGEYNGQRIGRVLRNFIFTGMGNVKTPANPTSEYTNIQASCIINSDIDDNIKIFSFLWYNKGITMVIENIEQAKEVIAKLEAENISLKEKQKTLVEASELEKIKTESKAKEDTSVVTIADLNDKLKGEASKLEIANKELVEIKASLEKTNELVKEKVKANDYLNAALEEYKKATKSNDRMAKLTEAGVVATEQEVTEYTAMSDETFAGVLAFAKKTLTKKKTDDTKDNKDNKDSNDKKDAEAALENATENKEKTKEEAANDIAENTSTEQDMKTIASELIAAFQKSKVINKKKIK